jgi:hypothetical protein
MSNAPEPADAASENAAPGGRRVGAAWKGLVRIRAQRLHDDLELAQSRSQDIDVAIVDRIRFLLDNATALASPSGPWQNLRTWVTGAEIEQAWASIHEADELLYLIHDSATLEAKIPELLAAVQSRLQEDDERRVAYEAALKTPSVQGPPDTSASTFEGDGKRSRELLRQIRRSLNEISDDAHGRVRNYRNIALGVTIVLSFGMLGVAFDAPNQPWLPVTHGLPPWPTIWQIELVGALGGLLAGVVAMRALEGFAGPYGLPVVMAALKIPAGALTGLLGALWMQNSVFGVLSPQDGLKVLAYVALFGYAQQAFTTFADRQAGQLLGEARGTQSA